MTLKERMAAGGCRACPSLRSSRSKVFCDVHLEQATRKSRARDDKRRGKGTWTAVKWDVAVEMRMMRSRGEPLAKIAEQFGYSVRTVYSHVRDVAWPRGRKGVHRKKVEKTP